MLKLLRTAKNFGVVSNLSNRSVCTSYNYAKQAVIFDMGGVIIPSPLPLLHRFAEEHNLSKAQMDELLFADGENSLWERLECGYITTETFSDQFSDRCKLLFGVPFEDKIINTMMNKSVKPYPEMLSAIKQLKEKGFKTALLTNNFIDSSGKSLLPLEKELFDVVSILFKNDF